MLSGGSSKGEHRPGIMNFRRFFLNAFNIESGEEKLVGQNLLQSFFIGMPRIFTMTAANTLFLNHFGSENLPYVYMAAAVIVPVIGFLHLFLEKKMTFSRHTSGTLVILCLALVILLISLKTPFAKWASIALLVWYTVEWVLTNAVFWNTANRLFTVRQAKRVFGLVGTGEVLAMILGGLVVPVFVRHLGTANLLMMSMAGNFLALLNFMSISRSSKFEAAAEEPHETANGEKTKGAVQLLRNKYILLTFSIVSLIYIAFYFVDNSFYGQVESRIPDEARMAGFLGQFFAVFGILNFVIKTFISGRFLTKFGVRGGLITAPLLIGFGAAGVVVCGVFKTPLILVFWFVALTKLLEGIFVDSITRPAYYTLFQPLPANIRSSSQSTAESVVAQIAGGLSGALLLFLNKTLSFTAVGLLAVLLGLIPLWIFVSAMASGEYRKALAKALTNRRLRGGGLLLQDPLTIQILEKSLHSKLPAEAKYSMTLLMDAEHPRIEALLLSMKDHPLEEVREAAYRMLATSATAQSFETLKQLLDVEKSPRVRGALLRALANAGEMECFEIVQAFLDDPDPDVRIGAIVGMIKSCGIEGAVTAGNRLLSFQISNDPAEREMAARILGEVGVSTFYRGLQILVMDENLKVREEAIESAGKLKNPKLWPLLIENLSVEAVKGKAARAIVEGGEPALSGLEAAYYSGNQNPASRARLVRLYGRIGGEKAMSLLKNKLGEFDGNLLLEILRALRSMGFHSHGTDRETFNKLIDGEVAYIAKVERTKRDISDETRFQLLFSSLEKEIEKSRERLFLILSFIYPSKEIARIQDITNSGSPEKRAFAIELFDNIVSKEHKERILPLLEDINPEERLKRLSAFYHEKEYECGPRLMEMASQQGIWENPWLRVCAIDSLKIADIPGADELIDRLVSDENPLVRETAEYAGSMDTGQYAYGRKSYQGAHLYTLEKVKLLRMVWMFADIPGETIAEVSRMTEDIELNPGDKALSQGEQADSLFIVASGEVKVHAGDRTLAVLGKRKMFGELSALCPDVSPVSVTATEKSFLLKLPKSGLYQLVEDRTDFARRLFNEICRRIKSSIPQKISSAEEKAGDRPAATIRDMQVTAGGTIITDSDGMLSSIEKVIILKSSEFFASTPDSVLADVVASTKEIFLKKGETLFDKDAPGSMMYIVVDGKIRIHSGELTLAELENRSILGEIALLTSEARTASATAIEDTKLLSLDQASLYELMWDQSEILRGIIKVLVGRLRKSINK